MVKQALITLAEQEPTGQPAPHHFTELERRRAQLYRHLLDRHHGDIVGYYESNGRHAAYRARQGSL